MKVEAMIIVLPQGTKGRKGGQIEDSIVKPMSQAQPTDISQKVWDTNDIQSLQVVSSGTSAFSIL